MSYFYQQSLFPYDELVNEYDDNVRLVMVLSTLQPYLEPLVRKLELERMGRRDKYPVRMLMNTFIASYVYQIPVKNELIRELRRNGSLRRVVDAAWGIREKRRRGKDGKLEKVVKK